MYYKLIKFNFMVQIKTLSRTVRGHFLRKNFSWFFVWVNFGDSQTIFGTQAGRKPSVPVRYDLPVAIRWSLLRRKEEGKLKAFEKYLVDEKINIFLDALWFGTQSLAFIEFYSHC